MIATLEPLGRLNSFFKKKAKFEDFSKISLKVNEIPKFVKAFFELKRSHVLLNISTKDEYSSKFIFDETP